MLCVRMMAFTFAVILMGTLLPGCSSSSKEEAIQVHRDKARDLVEKQQFREALASYQQVLQLDPKDDEAYYQLALLHLRLGEPIDVELAHAALLRQTRVTRAQSTLRVAEMRRDMVSPYFCLKGSLRIARPRLSVRVVL